jgi:hypothetical protein
MRWSAFLLLTLFACGDDLSSNELTVAFDKTPSEISNLTRPEFVFHASDAVSRMTCTVDTAPAITCRSPFTIDLTEGAHTLTVTAVGEAQQVGQVSYQWSVDASPPETQLTLSPPALDGEASSTVMFATSSEDVSRYECSLDDAPFATCTSPVALSVEDGLHTFRVRSVDRAGNPDPTPASTSWSVDTSAPLVTFTEGPIGPVASTRPMFAFGAPPNVRGLECKLDGAAYAACTSPLTTAELAQGAHTFAVRATALTGNTGTVVRAFLVDTVGPAITIVSGPTGATDSTPTWTFTLAEAPTTATCRVDAAAWTACNAGVFTSQPLGDGDHVFEIEARDALGNPSTLALPFSLDTSTCGDGVIDPTLDEVCDGGNLGGATCASVGDFDGGTLACTTTCGFDTSGCRKCGNGVIESPESCDGSNLGGATCATYGFTAGALGCGATCGVDTSGCGTCGDGTAQLPEETCDGDDLRGATCASLGQGTGTLRCNAGCGGYDTGGCSGGDGYAPANTGFTGKPCFDGLRYSTPNYSAPYVLACTEEHGLFKTQLGSPMSWYGVNGGGITNLKGRAIATNPSGPPVYFVTDPGTTNNAFRSNNYGETWAGQSIHNAGVARDIFAFIFRPLVGNIAGSWDPELGATVLHGAPPNLVPHFVGAAPGSVTGTVRAIASGGPKDVLVAVHGQTPSGAPATGGIYRACDLTGTGGGSYTARHDGIAADDLARVWSITVDPSSIVPTAFLCGSTSVSGYATTYYAALRGGSQIYKTTDGGVSWSPRNTGLPAGAEVNAIALHCFSGTTAPTCNNPDRLYAATSVGLFTSADAGAHWELDGFAGKSVRAVTLDPVATPPHLFVGVDDAVGIYQSL